MDYQVSGGEVEFEMVVAVETEELNMIQVTEHLIEHDGFIYML